MTYSLATITASELNRVMAVAIDKGREESKTAEPHWYPCGFAWLAIKMRKNGRLAKTLIALGFRWDDYAKHYYTSMTSEIGSVEGMWQSMDYRARILTAVRNHLKDNGLTEFYVATRID